MALIDPPPELVNILVCCAVVLLLSTQACPQSVWEKAEAPLNTELGCGMEEEGAERPV